MEGSEGTTNKTGTSVPSEERYQPHAAASAMRGWEAKSASSSAGGTLRARESKQTKRKKRKEKKKRRKKEKKVRENDEFPSIRPKSSTCDAEKGAQHALESLNLDNLFRASRDPEIAVLVQYALVAGLVPPVWGERLAGQFDVEC